MFRSCSLQPFADIEPEQLEQVCSFLHSEADSEVSEDSSSSSEDENEAHDWDDWKDEQAEPPDQVGAPRARRLSSREERQRVAWLRKAHVASVVGVEQLLVAFGRRFAVLRRRRLSESLGNLATAGECLFGFETVQQALLDVEYGEATAACCVPVASQRATETTPHDWVCAVVGCASGHTLFHSERGSLLLVAQFSRTPVGGFHLARGLHGCVELIIAHSDCFVAVDGLSLYTALRGCRSHLARGGDVAELSQVTELNFRKMRTWRFDQYTDYVGTGALKPTLYDQLEAASTSGNFFAVLRPSLPHYCTYLFAGDSPYLDFCWRDDGGQSSLTDTLYGIADKVKTSLKSQLPFGLSGWGGGEKAKKRAEPVDVRASKVDVRSSLADAGRSAERIYHSADYPVAAVADSQARVCLVHTKSRIVLRVWKGYRDAQCAWIRASAPKGGAAGVRAHFLAIYAPRRGLLELWAMQNGPRVAAFNVDRHGRLLTDRSGLVLGQHAQSSHASPVDAGPTVFFLHSSGLIQQVCAPYHAALRDASVAQTHDDALVRQFGQLASEPPAQSGAFVALFDQLRTTGARRQVVEQALQQSQFVASTAATVVDHSLAKLTEQGRPLSVEERLFYVHLLAYKQLLNGYATQRAAWQSDMSLSEAPESVDVAEALSLSSEQLDSSMDALRRVGERHSAPPTEDLTLHALFAAYDFAQLATSCDDKIGRGETVSTECDFFALQLSASLTAAQRVCLGRFLFAPVVDGKQSVAQFVRSVAPQFGVGREHLVGLFCSFWLTCAADHHAYPPLLLELLAALSSHDSNGQTVLQLIQDELCRSTNVAAAFALCLVARALSRRRVRADDGADWDAVEPDVEKWDTLLSNMHCLVELSVLVDGTEEVSLNAMAAVGRHYILAAVGRWAARSDYAPDTVVAALRVEKAETETAWKLALGNLGRLLPLSLERADGLLCEMSWAAGRAWSADADDVAMLERAVTTLAEVDAAVYTHGLAFLLWDTFVRTRYEALGRLLDKVGRLPKDRLCRREVGVADVRLSRFNAAVVRLLRLLLEANIERDYAPTTPTRHEDFVESLFDLSIGGEGRPAEQSMATTAAMQNCTNFVLVKHQLHLALVIELQLDLGMKAVRPLSLFDDKGRRALLDDFHTHPLLSPTNVDESTRQSRQLFCERAVRAAIESAAAEVSASHMAAAHELANEWALDVDRLRRHEMVSLLETGRDADCERLLPTVTDGAAAACSLLPVAGVRLRRWLETDDVAAGVDRWSTLSARTHDWLRSLPPPDTVAASAAHVDSVGSLIRHLAAILPANSAESTLANEMLAVIDSRPSECSF